MRNGRTWSATRADPMQPEAGVPFGLWRALGAMRSRSTNEPCFQQVDLSATVHLPLDELELGDLAFSLSVRPS